MVNATLATGYQADQAHYNKFHILQRICKHAPAIYHCRLVQLHHGGGGVGSFINENDKRHNLLTHRHDHVHFRNISFSFNPATLTCPRGSTEFFAGLQRGAMWGWTTPPCSFSLIRISPPRFWTVQGERECLKIIQFEDGSLSDLVEVFLGVTRGFDVPAGAVVLMASTSHAAASHEATIGSADYAVDFVRASGLLRGPSRDWSQSSTVPTSSRVAPATGLHLGQSLR